jgi:hypothetical protein
MLAALINILPTLGSLITGWLGYRIGTKRAGVSATVANAAANVAEDESAVQGWQKLAAEYRGQFEVLTSRIGELDTKVSTMQAKITVLEQERDQHRFWRLIGVTYIKALLEVLSAHNIAPPVAPVGLNLDS